MGFIKLLLGTIRHEAMKSFFVVDQDPDLDQEHQKDGNTLQNEIPNEESSFPLKVEIGRSLMMTYLRRGHPRHPFLAYSTIVDVCEKVLYAGASHAHVSDQDVFRAYAIMAIGAAYRSQELRETRNEVPNPARLFDITMGRASQVNLLNGVDGIQNLLLISRYGFFCLTGISLWEISSLCIHICIDHGLHQSPMRPLSAFDEQMRRRVFWQCYNLNRHCSTTLGLPFGIPDADIQVGDIVDVEDEVLYAAVDPLDTFALPLPNVQRSLSLMIWQTQLRRICSLMREEFKHLRSDRSKSTVFHDSEIAATVWEIHSKYSEQLSSWRAHYPIRVKSSEQTELYLSSSWRDLHYFQERLLLVRCSIEHSPTRLGEEEDVLDFVEELYECASAVVQLYSHLLEENSMEPTVGRMYRLLTAGLSALFTVVTESQNSKRASRTQKSRTWGESRLSLLKLCRNTLATMSTRFMRGKTPANYVKYYDLLCREVLKNFVEPFPRQNRTSLPPTRVEVQANREARLGSEQSVEDGGARTLLTNSTSMTTYPSVPFLDSAFVQSATYLSPGIESVGSFFSWPHDPEFSLDFTELTCGSLDSHPQPCYCNLELGNSVSQESDVPMHFDGYINDFPLERNQLYGANYSAVMDDLLLADWGNILPGSNRFPFL